ncbi:4-hydroxy-tetrahydrodipicolinate reductase [Carboxylicivirga sp. M1479]|uniref:4-hydroxy-tetrahydrodipicolinate reductase n=1 Tax=Carboxylicivirga sp. M1479 TaxID=2594476 RepID=UPI001177C091|nr:4-hydroxy-tetrahydrodipicolinate reductase [Carboxylicivirga sp. M1479]TRX63550.1 4-hydroxy-tetrahydrodipicolinate reductase [Carboxylicivirga sp. M1479]
MKIALIGYGKMGQEIEKIALDRGHEIVSKIDVSSEDSFTDDAFKSADVAIEFTRPEAAYDNYMKCFDAKVPVVSGTTGWLDKLAEIKDRCDNDNQTFFYASNFSLGVNIFFELNKQLARIMNKMDEYNVSMEEVHHTQKLDAPSGTAITLAEGIIENIDKKNDWKLDQEESNSDLAIKAIREGQVPGIHTVKYESSVDEIIIHHSAKSRKGFALGAVLAAEFASKNSGYLSMNDLLNF